MSYILSNAWLSNEEMLKSLEDKLFISKIEKMQVFQLDSVIFDLTSSLEDLLTHALIKYKETYDK